ncbi:diguanylate cyclase (GGDEF)-like protein [Comamonas odontotermitis]|uniref:Diguanylate cyclase (GGDEF)-like protein n=1 Tax=Comamonas odontotermitis TaxID=379895 RepID=A0ABR6RHF2_9BURK|nr:diguanylate cyclase [Comamonas odontotermitis]MBB6578569.1 diguanylate cyclase (GGDEF)-like protein [Comamonas odontotermitis]
MRRLFDSQHLLTSLHAPQSGSAVPGRWALQLMVVVPLMLLLAMALAGWLVLRSNQEGTMRQMVAQQADETELLAKLIGSKLEQSQKVLAAVAEAAAPWALDSRPTLEWLLDQGLPATRYFDSMVFARGAQVFRLDFRSGDGDRAEVEPAERDLLRRVIVDGKPQVSDPVKSTLGGPSIALGIPLRAKDGSVQGAIAGVLRLQSQSLLPVSLAVPARENAQLVVMSTSGVVISHPDPSRILGMAVDEPALAQALRLWSERERNGASTTAQAWWRAPQLISVAEIPAARWLVVRVVQHETSSPLVGPMLDTWSGLTVQALALVMVVLSLAWLWWHTRKLRVMVAEVPPPMPGEVLVAGDELDQIGRQLRSLQQQQSLLERRLQQKSQLADTVLESARFSMLLLKDERMVQVSQALSHLLGYDRGDLEGQGVQLLAMDQADLDALWSQVQPQLLRDGSAEATVSLRHQSGAPVIATVQLVRVPGVTAGYLWCFVRAGQARVASRSATQQDKLTELPSYDALFSHLTAMLQAQREGLDGSSPSAPVLFYVNVDNMSSINALAGHAQGDLVLQQVARQLQMLQPFQGFAARVAGDKFALVLRQCSREKADALARQLCEALQNWQPELRGKHFLVTVSIGLLHMDAGFADAHQVIRAADMTCYEAKRHGGNSVHWRADRAEADGTSLRHG